MNFSFPCCYYYIFGFFVRFNLINICVQYGLSFFYNFEQTSRPLVGESVSINKTAMTRLVYCAFLVLVIAGVIYYLKAEHTHELGAKSCGNPILQLADNSRIFLSKVDTLSARQLRDAAVGLPGILIKVEPRGFEFSVGAGYCYNVYTCEPFIRQC